jgi:hypothetical protein
VTGLLFFGAAQLMNFIHQLIRQLVGQQVNIPQTPV